MTFPTTLNPWFVVLKHSVEKRDVDTLDVLTTYWSTDGEGAEAWVTNPHQAMLFMQLSSAARIAATDTDAIVRVIYSKDGLREFRPREFNEDA
jgi:hypothetical protein